MIGKLTILAMALCLCVGVAGAIEPTETKINCVEGEGEICCYGQRCEWISVNGYPFLLCYPVAWCDDVMAYVYPVYVPVDEESRQIIVVDFGCPSIPPRCNSDGCLECYLRPGECIDMVCVFVPTKTA